MKKDRKVRKKARILSICLVCLFVTVSFGACKNTDVLEEIIYDNDAEQTDTDTEQISQSDTEDAEEDEDLKSEELNEDTDREKETQTDSSVEGDADNDTENNASLKASEDADATQGTSDETVSSDSGSASNKTKSGSSSKKSKSGSGSSGKKDKSNEGSGEADDEEITAGTRKENDAEILDANGSYVKIPSDVETVAAVGEVAVMVEMLGGDGRLVATSESLTDNELAQKVFDDLEDAVTLWEEDGTEGISSSDFKKLVKLCPDVCLVTSGESIFTDAQLATLEENDIPVVTVYRMNLADNILENADLIGELLGTDTSDGKKNAVKMAQKYSSWYEKYIAKYKGTRFTDYTLTDYNNDVVSSGGSVKYLNAQGSGCYTLFIEYWDTTAEITVKSNESLGVVATWSGGAPATDSGYSNSPLSYYMSMAGVVNSAASESARLGLKSQYTWYVNGWLNTQTVVYISGQFTDYKASDSSNGPYLSRVRTSSLENTQLNTVPLGSDDFDTVIVSNSDIKTRLKSSMLLKSYDLQTEGGYSYYGFRSGGLRYETSVSDSYDIVVNPYGVSCWYEGSVEAPLEMMWIGYTFGTTSADEEDLYDVIRTFYDTFYDYDISDSDIAKVLKGSYAR